MTDPYKPLADINWDDDSPPNLIAIGQILDAAESDLKEKGLTFHDGYVGGKNILDDTALECLDFKKVKQVYSPYVDALTSETCEIKQERLDELIKAIVGFIQSQNEGATEEKTELEDQIKVTLNSQDDLNGLEHFIIESLEIIDALDELTPKLRTARGDATLLNQLFRKYHTVKGAAGFFGLDHISKQTHQLENVLDRARKGTLIVDDEVITIMLKANSWLETQFNKLKGLLGQIEAPCEAIVDHINAGPVHYGCMAILAREDEIVTMDEINQERVKEESFIKISQDYLDEFLNGVGNLLNLAHVFKHSENVLEASNLTREVTQRFKDNFVALEFETESLQKKMMQLRRVKINQLLKKIPKIVFQLSQTVGKSVEVKMTGEEIELDKSMLDALNDPIVHLLRNSLDHGFETSEERVEVGKNECCTLNIDVKDANANVEITIKDDGRGINGDKVAESALDKGLISDKDLQTMSETEKQELIFMPGFSTMATATELSGRGVGMDVIKNQVISVGGEVHLNSTRGEGTTITILLPKVATLATRAVLKVRAAGQVYGVPLSHLEYLYCHDKNSGDDLPEMNGLELLSFRGKNIPVIHLGELMKGCKAKLNENEERYFIITNSVLGMHAVEVDEMDEFETLVLQELKAQHFSETTFEGGAVMGDGSICLLLEMERLLDRADLQMKTIGGKSSTIQLIHDVNTNRSDLVIVRPSNEGELVSVDIKAINRIEKFDKSKLTTFKQNRIYHSVLGLMPYLEFNEFGIGGELPEGECPNEVLVLNVADKLIAVGVLELIDMYFGEIKYLGPPRLIGLSDSWSYNGKLVGALDVLHIMKCLKAKSFHSEAVSEQKKLVAPA